MYNAHSCKQEFSTFKDEQWEGEPIKSKGVSCETLHAGEQRYLFTGWYVCVCGDSREGRKEMQTREWVLRIAEVRWIGLDLELAGTAVDRNGQVEMCGRKRNYIEEVTGREKWDGKVDIWANTRTRGERFEVVGVR